MPEKKKSKYELDPGKIRIYPNFNRKGNQPTHRGVAVDDMGEEWTLSLWKNEMDGGGFYLSGNMIRKSELKGKIEKQEEERKRDNEDFDFLPDA